MIPQAHRFKKTVFENGLTLVTERHRQYRGLSIAAWVKAGTRHESLSESGLSHFLEHMLFKGTRKRSALDIALQVDQVGGEFNAFTAREHTCFHLMMLNRDASLGLEILEDIILNSTFDSAELERERKVILQEISMVDESPEELVHDLFFEKIYGKHGLGRPILGTETSIKRTRRLDLLRFFRKHYRPEQVLISVAGDISHEAVLKKMKGLTKKKWPGRKSLRIKKGLRTDQNQPPFKQGKWWVERSTEQVHLVWGVEGPSYDSKDRFAAFLLNVYLGGGMSSALFQEIREKNGLAYTVYSTLSPFFDTGIFSIYAATGPSQVPLCLKLIRECLHRVKTQLMSEAELNLIKDNLKGTILLSADNMESRMNSIAKNDISLGRYVSLSEVCASIDAVTPQDLKRVARKLFGRSEGSLVALGPKPKAGILKKLSFVPR